MKANRIFQTSDLEFWANVKLLNQRLGYYNKKSDFMIPTKKQIVEVFNNNNFDVSKIVIDGKLTKFGSKIINYFEFRKQVLNDDVKPMLLDVIKAKSIFQELKKELNPNCPLPMNKQKGNKKDFAFFTCIINMLIESNSKGFSCNYDPRELTAFTKNNSPFRILSRRVDGAFPNIINPVAIWEIKEYYYTTTFGSRVADGVYESLLDGLELQEVDNSLNINTQHIFMIDDYNTWWNMGKSYLCRIIDMLHMGLVSEVLFGEEVIEKLPILVNEWMDILNNK